MKDLKKMNGAEILSAPLFRIIRKKHPKLYGRFYGNLFRSTMNLKKKISLLENFLARGDIDEIITLTKTFNEVYKTEDITKRNSDLRNFYGI